MTSTLHLYFAGQTIDDLVTVYNGDFENQTLINMEKRIEFSRLRRHESQTSYEKEVFDKNYLNIIDTIAVSTTLILRHS